MREHRVTEIFGPTIQGEGFDAGVPAHFVRFGGCDFRCVWCDTPHAVLLEEVRNLPQMSPEEICGHLGRLRPQAGWVILTGGNPALRDLGPLVDLLHRHGYLVALETQGTLWKDWMVKVDRLCVSPKPPSSTMHHKFDTISRFISAARESQSYRLGNDWMFIKVVVFDDTDLDWAERLREQHAAGNFYLSAGNDAGRTVGNPERVDHRSSDEVRQGLLERARWLTEEILRRPRLSTDTKVHVQAQYHVLMWGNELGR